MISYKRLLIIISIIAICWIGCKHLYIHDYTVKGVCVGKMTNSDKGGNFIYYHVFFKMEDGSGREEDTNVTGYVSYEVGITYIFNEHEILWK